MTKQEEFEIYLYIDNNRFKIFLFDSVNFKNLYTKELLLNNTFSNDFNELIKFLDDNIFKIEKLCEKFVENIVLIINSNSELQTNISIKKKINNHITDRKTLNQVLVELKDLFKESNKEQDIIHMVIENFIINEKSYKFFVENLKSDYLNLDVKFISLPNKFILKFNQVLEKYHIKVKYLVSGKYIKEFMHDKDIDLSFMTHKILNGHNINEIKIIPKMIKNKGFFEKFFQLFS